jgi:hypothetical protein
MEVQGSNPSEGEILLTVQTGPGAHPASYTIDSGSFPGLKRPCSGVDHISPSAAEVKGRVELHLYSLSGRSWPVIFLNLPLPLPLPCMWYDFKPVGSKREDNVSIFSHVPT